MNEFEQLVLGSFEHWGKDKLDLHTLFESGGNEPEARTEILYAVERLVAEGLLLEEGNDFYSLTDKGREAAHRAKGN